MEYLGMASKLKETMRNIRTSIVFGKKEAFNRKVTRAMTSRSDLDLDFELDLDVTGQNVDI